MSAFSKKALPGGAFFHVRCKAVIDCPDAWTRVANDGTTRFEQSPRSADRAIPHVSRKKLSRQARHPLQHRLGDLSRRPLSGRILGGVVRLEAFWRLRGVFSRRIP